MEIKFEHVSFAYNKDNILKDIHLTLKENKLYGITGHSGSGKTTLSFLMNALYLPTEGIIHFDNYKVSSKTRVKKTLRHKVSIVFQNPEESFFEDTVYNEILFGIRRLKLSQKNIDDKIKDIFEQLDLNKDILDKNPFLLSNGEKRKVAIASILIIDPEVIIFDEPTIGLDNKGKELLRKLLIRLKKKKTIIVISHDINFLHKVMDDIIIMRDGKIVKMGNKYKIFKEERALKRLKIQVPEMMEFINLVNKHHQFEDDYDDMKELMKAVYRDVK